MQRIKHILSGLQPNFRCEAFVTQHAAVVATDVCQGEQPIDEVCCGGAVGAPIEAEQYLQLHVDDLLNRVVGIPHVRAHLLHTMINPLSEYLPRHLVICTITEAHPQAAN